MIMTNIKNIKEDQKLIVECNVFNKEEMKKATVPGMDYTINVNFDRLTMGYVENIFTRVYVYGEKVVLIVNNESNDPNYDEGKMIFEMTNSITMKTLIEKSTLAIFDNTIIKDLYKEFNK